MLGLRLDATVGDVAAAYHRLTEDQDHRWKELEGDSRLASAMFTLKLRRREAYEALSDPERRAAYDRALGQMRPGPDVVPPTAPVRTDLGPDPPALDLVKEARRLQDRGRGRACPSPAAEGGGEGPDEPEARRELAIALAADPALAPQRRAPLPRRPGAGPPRHRPSLPPGGFYIKAGLRARALLHLRVVVGRDPNHAAAVRDLQELQGG